MKLTNGYPVATPEGNVWIVERTVEVVIVRDAAYPIQPYYLATEDEAVDAIETGVVTSVEWQTEHEVTYA